ncbi:hypothetical protein [Burkholderia gladioli]|uniref:hypothetical protein n=1 Tax=Burkholderia gladioli TaxID=28095 RepID=UPI00163F218E|nr:hypothetical protein [Burkholderia gladioli]
MNFFQKAKRARDKSVGLPRSPTFPRNTKPVHLGFYEVENLYSGTGWSIAHWDGRLWISTGTGAPMLDQRREWRGLSDKPQGDTR